MALVIGIVVVVLFAVAFLFFTANRRRSTGALSRETRASDHSTAGEVAAAASPSTDLEATGRERADETREMAGDVPAVRKSGEVVAWEPVDEEELGISRRQFLNRGLLTATGFSAGALGIGVLGFLWPLKGGGFGGKVKAGSYEDFVTYVSENREPLYVPDARAYLRPYPPTALPAAKKVYSPVILAGMEEGLVALWQRCVHLGCRVPWCQSSQWFECPCHGSKYNAVGEKRDGPAPRGLDRFPVTVDGGDIVIDTSTVVEGPPIGTNTTHQTQEGPACV
ncbi:MAG TPA: Rieske 2Fe-2S domain-containing protein [Acidimicrobiia bacterium]|nr:Rieske 2Fe-2S domain-containing protein [Acidimicrobiia bacterium]